MGQRIHGTAQCMIEPAIAANSTIGEAVVEVQDSESVCEWDSEDLEQIRSTSTPKMHYLEVGALNTLLDGCQGGFEHLFNTQIAVYISLCQGTSHPFFRQGVVLHMDGVLDHMCYCAFPQTELHAYGLGHPLHYVRHGG